MPIRAVVFDVGETLINEDRHWGEWADWLGVTRLTFFAALGAVIARDGHHREVFDIVRPGFDVDQAKREREATGRQERFYPGDLYPDVLPCFDALHDRGYRIGIAGNQPLEAEESLRRLGVTADFIASSAKWSVEKPSSAFFDLIVNTVSLAPQEIAYVGDRLDNDVLPAIQAGLVGVFLRRGPWGFNHATRPDVAKAHLCLETLTDLPDALRRI